MDENKTNPPSEGKRLLSGSGPWKKSLVIPLVAAAVLLAVYAGLCLWVALGGRILPGVYAGGELLGNLTQEEARQRLSAVSEVRLDALRIPFTYGEKGSAEIPGSWAVADAEAAAQNAWRVGREGSPLAYGYRFLSGFFRPTQADVPLAFTQEGEHALDALLRDEETPVTETLYTQETDAIRVTKGIPGLQYDREQVRLALLGSLAQALGTVSQPEAVHVDPVVTQPAPIDWEALAKELLVEPADATFDPETLSIIPSVTGVRLDVSQAATLYDSTPDGGTVTIPLTFTEPEITTEELEATLFHDLLGEANSHVSGVANRVSNVGLALELCKDVILMPGDVFSYWDRINPCSASQGFLPAPSYVNGQTVDSIGGGVCQVSSSIYYAALLSNLEIVERRNHSYAVGYLPDGADATVFSGNPDFRFRNNTDHPIKITGTLKNRELSVQIWGTKTDDTYVKMQFVELSRTYPETIYKPDESVPVGTTKVSVTPYTGRKTEAYRCIYSADGTLLSKTLESVSTYKKRDKVVLYNPADAYLYDPTVSPGPSPVPSEPPVETPEVTPDPLPTETPPVLTETPAPSESPAPTETPAPTEAPAPIETAAPSEPPVSPEFASPTPLPTDAPQV